MANAKNIQVSCSCLIFMPGPACAFELACIEVSVCMVLYVHSSSRTMRCVLTFWSCVCYITLTSDTPRSKVKLLDLYTHFEIATHGSKCLPCLLSPPFHPSSQIRKGMSLWRHVLFAIRTSMDQPCCHLKSDMIPSNGQIAADSPQAINCQYCGRPLLNRS